MIRQKTHYVSFNSLGISWNVKPYCNLRLSSFRYSIYPNKVTCKKCLKQIDILNNQFKK